jgi:hypothetical protein
MNMNIKFRHRLEDLESWQAVLDSLTQGPPHLLFPPVARGPNKRSAQPKCGDGAKPQSEKVYFRALAMSMAGSS